MAGGVDRLRLVLCESCLLVQRANRPLAVAAGPQALQTPGAPFARSQPPAPFATMMIRRFGLGPESQVMEVASLDGGGLAGFRAAGIPVLGIEPAPLLAAFAREQGIPTEIIHLNAETAMDIAAQHGRADLLVARGIVAEVEDLFGFAAGFAGILRPGGVAVIEFPHLLWLMERVRFGLLRQTQWSHLSLMVAERILYSVGLVVFDVEALPWCGSLRLYAGHRHGPYARRPSVKAMHAREMAAGLTRPETYAAFAPKVTTSIESLRGFINGRLRDGRRIIGYGATAEAATILACCGAGFGDLLCVADAEPRVQGRTLPGSGIPVVAPETAGRLRPDDVLIFSPDRAPDALLSALPRSAELWGMGPNHDHPRPVPPVSVARLPQPALLCSELA